MEQRVLGRTGMIVNRLGVGLSEIGYDLGPDEMDQAAAVLNTALDLGLNFLDTSACYQHSEAFIGESISHRRHAYYLATKAGHVTAGYQGRDWDYQTVRDSIERSLRRLRTDYLDLVQLHSCSLAVLAQGDAIRALQDARQAGQVRFIGYSGDNEAAAWAVDSGLFDTLQTSYNVVDQHARTRLFPRARAQNMGLIVKRPLANGVWAARRSPRPYADEYFRRAQAMARQGPVPAAPDSPILLALGFVLAEATVDTAIVGTRSPNHVRANVDWVRRHLPLPAAAVDTLQRRFAQVEDNWKQLR